VFLAQPCVIADPRATIRATMRDILHSDVADRDDQMARQRVNAPGPAQEDESPMQPHRKTPGVEVRHSRFCPSRDGGTCTAGRRDGCKPTFLPWVFGYDPKKRAKAKIRPPHGFTTLAAAKGWRTDAAAANRKGTLRPATRDTLNAAAEKWIAGARAGEILARGNRPYKPSVIRSYETALRLRVLDELGPYKLSELTLPDLQTFVNRMVAAKVDPSTIRNTVNPVRAVYRRALSVGDVAVNPTSGLQLPSVDGVRDRAASPDEAAELLDALPEDDRALWATAFYGGLRRGELRALRCEDVDPAANEIHVRRGWDDVEGAVDPKSKKGTRHAPISTGLKKLLAEQMARTGRRGTDLVFGRTAGAPFTPTHIRKRALAAWTAANVKRAEKKQASLVPIGLHECRHTYVSIMFAAGFPLEEIGDYVGHSSTFMVDRYRHLLPNQRASAAARLDAYLEESAVTSLR
jgi:integrase